MSGESPEVNVTVIEPQPVANTETPSTVGDALEIAKEISKADQALDLLQGLQSQVADALAQLAALSAGHTAILGAIEGVAVMCGALMAAEVEEEEEQEEVAEEIAAAVVGELKTEEIPATVKEPSDSAPPEEKKTRRRGFF